MIRVLFVCLGNICRSPMAEAVFQKMVDDAGLGEQIVVDSAGTSSWHAGEEAHPGTRRELARHEIAYDGRARVVQSDDVRGETTYVIAMDAKNKNSLRQRFGDLPRLYRLLDFAEHNGSIQDVPDPYYDNNFHTVYALVEDGCRGLLATIVAEEGLTA